MNIENGTFGCLLLGRAPSLGPKGHLPCHYKPSPTIFISHISCLGNHSSAHTIWKNRRHVKVNSTSKKPTRIRKETRPVFLSLDFSAHHNALLPCCEAPVRLNKGSIVMAKQRAVFRRSSCVGETRKVLCYITDSCVLKCVIVFREHVLRSERVHWRHVKPMWSRRISRLHRRLEHRWMLQRGGISRP